MKGQKKFRWLMYRKLLELIITNPLFLLVWAVTWFHLYSLCKYGRVYKNLPALVGCALCFAVFLILFIALCFVYKRKNGERSILRLMAAGQDSLYAEGGGDIRYSDIRKTVGGRKLLCLFLTEKRFAVLCTDDLDSDMLLFMKQKLGQLPFRRRAFLKPAAYAALLVISIAGVGGVVSSLRPYNGKLYSFLQTLKTQTKVKYVHDNILEDGIDGLLEDLETKIDLPPHLKLENSFNLHFAADGTVLSLDTAWSGFDGQYRSAGSWLISYDGTGEIVVVKGGVGSSDWQPDKDLQPLFDGLRVIDLKETVKVWNEEEYGILFYGARSFGYSVEGIRYIDRAGNVELPLFATEEFYGPAISVFVPGREKELSPVRYIFCEDVTKEKNVQGRQQAGY